MRSQNTLLNSSVNIVGGNFRSNVATSSSNGGAIAITALSLVSLSKVVLDGISLVNNTAWGNGGGIFMGLYSHVQNTSIDFSQVSCERNLAVYPSSGGAGYLLFQGTVEGADISFRNGFFRSNFAGDSGGSVEISFFNLIQSSISITSCSFLNNTGAAGSGGSVHITVNGLLTAGFHFTLKSSQFFQNCGFYGGNAVRILSSTSQMEGSVFVVENSTFVKNTCLNFISLFDSNGIVAFTLQGDGENNAFSISGSNFETNMGQSMFAVAFFVTGSLRNTTIATTSTLFEDNSGAIGILLSNVDTISLNVLGCLFKNNTAFGGKAVSITVPSGSVSGLAVRFGQGTLFESNSNFVASHGAAFSFSGSGFVNSTFLFDGKFCKVFFPI